MRTYIIAGTTPSEFQAKLSQLIAPLSGRLEFQYSTSMCYTPGGVVTLYSVLIIQTL